MSLAGKTLFISGASRGIGLAIAKRAAADGANVAMLAKTVEPHPKLPGTIYTAAAEIEAAGGKALAIACDIRDENAGLRGRAAGRRAFRRHRHPGEQRERDQPDRHRRDADEALRSDVRRERARHLRVLAGVPALSESRRRRPAATRTSSRLSPPLNMQPKWLASACRLHDGEVRHEHVHDRHGRGISRPRHRGEFAVAAHGDRHRRAADDSRRPGQAWPHARRSWPMLRT